MLLPRTLRSSSSSAVARSRPSNITRQPDSPTTPSVRPCSTVRSTPSTARITPARVENDVRRPSTFSSGPPIAEARLARPKPAAGPARGGADQLGGARLGLAQRQRPRRVGQRLHEADALGQDGLP